MDDESDLSGSACSNYNRTANATTASSAAASVDGEEHDEERFPEDEVDVATAAAVVPVERKVGALPAIVTRY